MKKRGGSLSTIIIGPSKSVLVYALHSLEKRHRPCPISGVCVKIIIIIFSAEHLRVIEIIILLYFINRPFSHQEIE